jgi:predicted restriction endonuclease
MQREEIILQLWEDGKCLIELNKLGHKDAFNVLALIFKDSFNDFLREARRRRTNYIARQKRNARKREIQACKTEYGGLFTSELKNKIRAKYDYSCVICGEHSQSLHVHHIDYDKLNCSESNLIPLCMKHHAQTTFGERTYWTKYLKQYIKD